MKTIFKLLILSFLLLTKCSKEFSFEKGEVYHLTCTVGGIPTTFLKFAAGDHTDPGNGNLSIYGIIDTSVNFNPAAFGFELYGGNKKVIVGEYTGRDSDFDLNAVYTDAINQLTYTAGSALADRARADGVIIDNQFKVSITELKKNTVRGIFSGNFYENGDPKGTIIKIADGDFYLKMK